jgi:hypothetical protein
MLIRKYQILKIFFYWQIFKVQLNVLKSFFYTSKSLKSKYAHFLLCNTNRCMYLPVDHLWLTCEINKTLLTRYFMGLFITLGLISRPSAEMLSPAQHLSVYAVNCTEEGVWDVVYIKSIRLCMWTLVLAFNRK